MNCKICGHDMKIHRTEDQFNTERSFSSCRNVGCNCGVIRSD